MPFNRGEATIKLQGPQGEETHDLRLTFTAICEIEERTKTNVFKILQIMAQGNGIDLAIMTSIIWAGIRGANEGSQNRSLTFEGVGERVLRTGIVELLVPVAEFMSKALANDKQIAEAEANAKKGSVSVGNTGT
jgi:hypothetical protein